MNKPLCAARRRGMRVLSLVTLSLPVFVLSASARAQDTDATAPRVEDRTDASVPNEARSVPRRTKGSKAPAGVAGTRLIISIADRTLSAIRGADTIFFAPVGVATGMTLSYAGRSWSFATPRGGRRVLRKLADPVWTPPDWHYAEVAREYGLMLAHVPAGGLRLKDGRRLLVKNGVVGLILPKRGFFALPLEEHVVFGDKLFVPPLGTKNRKITRELGEYALDLGNGYMIHGTPEEATVGQASTHGCLRMRRADLEWLYRNVPVGAPVTIH
ncbi:MAG: L,D-transpeptidase [Gemmatimonadaceae bacterium]